MAGLAYHRPLQTPVSSLGLAFWKRQTQETEGVRTIASITCSGTDIFDYLPILVTTFAPSLLSICQDTTWDIPRCRGKIGSSSIAPIGLKGNCPHSLKRVSSNLLNSAASLPFPR